MAKKLNISAALKKAGLVGAGAVGAQALENIAGKIPVIKNAVGKPAILGAGKIVLGALLPGLMKGKDRAMLEHVGDGMAAVGALQLTRALFPAIVAPISGIDDVLAGIEGDESYNMDGGYGEAVSGTDDDTLAGLDDVL